jgi:hypothetical protein
MLNPISLEIIVEDIQVERRHEADMERLAKCGKSGLRFQGRLSHFLTELGRQEKEAVRPAAAKQPL